MTPVARIAQTNRLSIALGLPIRNANALRKQINDLYDPSSVQYHRFLTPEKFTELFGPTEQDYQAMIDFAVEKGFVITGRHSNRMLLNLEGTAKDIEKTFGLNLQIYAHPTEARTFFAPDAEPIVPQNLPLLHISGLNDFTRPHPMDLRAANVTGSTPKAGSGANGAFFGKDFRAAYVPGTGLTGAGQIVGLFELEGYYASDITLYESRAGLHSVPLQNVLIDGFNGIPAGRRPGSANEEVALDIEMVISMAPGLASVVVYEAAPAATAANIDNLLNRMATDNLAKQISCSWGFDIDATTQQIFQQFAAQGQSFFLASGDSGAFNGTVLQPADNPNITIVGGTTLSTDTAHAWVSESTWNSGGGGISTVYPIPDWQAGVNMSTNGGSATMRNVPDVAMLADNVLAIVDKGRSSPFSGTSIAAPLWAAFTALANEQAAANGQAPVGFICPAIYALGQSSNYVDVFHDITTGNNSNGGGVKGFSAVRGYDLCTGWGTPNGTNLINALLAPAGDAFVIFPPLGFSAQSLPNGQLNITSQTYSLTNMGMAPLEWMVVNPAPWLDVSPTNGVLSPGAIETVTVSVNSQYTNYLIGALSASVGFTNVSTGFGQNRRFTLSLGNGGFEKGNLNEWTLSGGTNENFTDSIDFSTFQGAQTIPGVDDSLFVHSGLYGVFLGQPKTLGTLSRILSTAPGQQYILSFWLANPAPGDPNEFRVSWNGATLFDQSNMGQFAWTNMQYKVIATGTTTTLQFGFRNDQNAFGLDDVSVYSTPLPKIASIAAVNGSISLNWSGLADIAYQVQYTSDLNQVDWLPLAPPVTAVNSTVTVSDPIGLSQQRFYRLVTAP